MNHERFALDENKEFTDCDATLRAWRSNPSVAGYFSNSPAIA
jgi:hypothetical protein